MNQTTCTYATDFYQGARYSTQKPVQSTWFLLSISSSNNNKEFDSKHEVPNSVFSHISKPIFKHQKHFTMFCEGK